MGRDEIINLITVKALSLGLDPKLVQAIGTIETNLRDWVIRFEPNFMYYYNPKTYASNLGITLITERNSQQTSYGVLQIMGAVARELGFDEELQRLCEADLGIEWGCKKIVDLKKKYVDVSDLISAYNAGSPSKIGTKYRNQEYVDKVLKEYKKISG